MRFSAMLCIILWWVMAAGCLGIAEFGRRDVVAGHPERGRGLIAFGLSLAGLVSALGVPLTIALWRWLSVA